MLVNKLCQNFLSSALSFCHEYRKNAVIDATLALVLGARATLNNIGRHMPGNAQVKHKIKRTDRLLGNPRLHKDINIIFKQLTQRVLCGLNRCIIVIDWSSYPVAQQHIIRASLVYDGRSLPLMSEIVPIKQLNTQKVHKAFLNALHKAVPSHVEVYILTDAGFKCPWFQHVLSLGWHFIGRVRGKTKWNLSKTPQVWIAADEAKGKSTAEYLGKGTLSLKNAKQPCYGHFYVQKRASKGRTHKPGRGNGNVRSTSRTVEKQRKSSTEPWLIFTSTDKFRAKKVMALYGKRMQIEQNFRDDKSDRLGFGLRGSRSRDIFRLRVLSLLLTLATWVLWLLGNHAESKGLHRHYQSNSVKDVRVLSFLTLAENVLRRDRRHFRCVTLNDVLARVINTYPSVVFGDEL